ncbi:MAG TPA: alpha/beta hydrolase [Burkholderiaceae bacterium]|nr:alpha/beta hydrolase [Burkholderiaceae bacterium]
MQIQANGLRLEVDDQGPPASPGGAPIVLVMGLGMQLVAWPDPFVRRLVDAGRRVIRFDNRDAGLSEGFDHLGAPGFGGVMLRYWLHLPVPAPYTIGDMAADTLGLLDALNLPRVHVVGASMGGMIAQHLAARHPERVARLTLMMTTSGARHLPQPSARVRMALLDRRHAPADIEGLVDHLESVMTLIGSPAYRPDRETLRLRLRAMVTRAFRPAGTLRQVVAVVADGDRSPLLPRIEAPTRIVHGAADPLVPVAAAHDLAAKIAGAELEVIAGMGHDLPEPLWARLAEAVLRP